MFVKYLTWSIILHLNLQPFHIQFLCKTFHLVKISHSNFLLQFKNSRHDALLKKQSLSKTEKQQVMKDFEGEMRTKKHTHCKCCRRIRLKQEISTKEGICKPCQKYKDHNYYLKNNALPVWYENGDTNNKPNFHLPSELKNLTLSEKCSYKESLLSLHFSISRMVSWV